MGHIALLGDSIFDNAHYVPGGQAVIEHLRRGLSKEWSATLLAVDGAVTRDVERQLRHLPRDCTHLVLSIGGNDALQSGGGTLRQPADSVHGALSRLAEVQEQFQDNYRGMLRGVLEQGRPTAVCTVYDSVPGLSRRRGRGMCLFNDVILREAFRAALQVIDLRLICTKPNDYADVSPIEPSATGGVKIARAICNVFTGSDSGSPGSQVFANG